MPVISKSELEELQVKREVFIDDGYFCFGDGSFYDKGGRFFDRKGYDHNNGYYDTDHTYKIFGQEVQQHLIEAEIEVEKVLLKNIWADCKLKVYGVLSSKLPTDKTLVVIPEQPKDLTILTVKEKSQHQLAVVSFELLKPLPSKIEVEQTNILLPKSKGHSLMSKIFEDRDIKYVITKDSGKSGFQSMSAILSDNADLVCF